MNTNTNTPADAAPQDEPIGYLCRHSAQEKWFFSETPGFWEHKPVYERAALPAQAVAHPSRVVDYDMLGNPITADDVEKWSPLAALAAPAQDVAPTDAREVPQVFRDVRASVRQRAALFLQVMAERKGLHPDDAAVDAFAAEMKDKLAAARAKGRGGWQDCDPLTLSAMLREHVEKGDPLDVANFCMFLWHLDQPIIAAPQAGVQAPAAPQAVPTKERGSWVTEPPAMPWDAQPAAQPADAQPFAYVVRADTGNTIIWSTTPDLSKAAAKFYGRPLEALYLAPATVTDFLTVAVDAQAATIPTEGS